VLNQHGVVVRGRRVLGRDGDAVIKLRPVVPDELPALLRRDPAFGVEVDAMPGGSRLLELATKCPPSDAFGVATEAKPFLADRGVDLLAIAGARDHVDGEGYSPVGNILHVDVLRRIRTRVAEVPSRRRTR
jgi:hypothetical protein